MLLQVGDAVETTVGRRDVLGAAGDGRVRHGRVGVRGLVHGLELQPLVVDPQVRGLEVLGVALVLVGAVGGLGRSTLPGRSGCRESSFMRRVVLMINILDYLFILHRLLQSRSNRASARKEGHTFLYSGYPQVSTALCCFARIVGFTSGYYEIDVNNRRLY